MALQITNIPYNAAYFAIQTITLPAEDTNITFTTVPTTYSQLYISYQAKGGTLANSVINLRFNADSGNNYATAYLFVQSNTVTGNNNGSDSHISIDADTTTTGQKNTGTILINLNTGITGGHSVYSQAEHTGDNLTIGTGTWKSTATITSISIYLNTGSFATGSSATMWGVK